MLIRESSDIHDALYSAANYTLTIHSTGPALVALSLQIGK